MTNIPDAAAEQCKPGEQHDAHTRVRKMAAAMRYLLPPDPRTGPVLDAALARETDRRLRLHIGRALSKHRS